jgi:hypothetical protein
MAKANIDEVFKERPAGQNALLVGEYEKKMKKGRAIRQRLVMKAV